MADASTLRTRIAKIAGRFGSDFEGERAAAALLASRILKDHGTTWSDVLAPSLNPRMATRATRPEPKPAPRPHPVHHKAVAALLLRPGLRNHERAFLQSLLGHSALTRIQSHVLASIHARLDDQAGGQGHE
ncbi:MAG: hypothetical protein ACR2IG_02330 [Roseomonas sp.]